jgi:hypothetical protein
MVGKKEICVDHPIKMRRQQTRIYIHARKTNKMHLYLINLFQLNYPLHVSNILVHHQEVISLHLA